MKSLFDKITGIPYRECVCNLWNAGLKGPIEGKIRTSTMINYIKAIGDTIKND